MLEKLNRVSIFRIAGTAAALALVLSASGSARAQGAPPAPPPAPPAAPPAPPPAPPPAGTADAPPAGTADAPPATAPEGDTKTDDENKKKKGATAADAPAEGEGTPSTGGASGSGASGSGATAGATVSLGTTPPKDTASDEEAKKKEKDNETHLFFEGSTLYAQTSASMTTFSPSMQQTQASTVESWFLFQPRFTISKDWQARVRATLNYEWTDTANTTTTTKNEPMFGDTIFYLMFRGIPAIPKVGIKTQVGILASTPTSKASWARRLIVSPGPIVALSKTFEKVAGATINLGVSGSFSHPFYTNTSGASLNATSYQWQCAPIGGGDAASCGSNGGFGKASAENVLSFIFSASAEWKLPKKWGSISPSAVMFWTNAWAYQFSDVPLSSVTGTATPGNVPRLADRTNFSQSTYFNLAFEYSPTKWLGIETGYYMFRSLIKEDGKLGNPFFDDMQDMRLYLAANFTLDQLYLAATGGDKHPAKAAKLNPFPAGPVAR